MGYFSMRSPLQIAESIELALTLKDTHPGIRFDSDELRELAAYIRQGSSVPADVRRLVIAARVVAFDDRSPNALKELDEASEAFAERVPWEEES